MPPEWESGSHESPDDSSNNPQTLELLCHLDNTAHGSVAWYAARYRFNPAASPSLFPSFIAFLFFFSLFFHCSWLLFPSLSVALHLSQLFASPLFNLLFCSFLDGTYPVFHPPVFLVSLTAYFFCLSCMLYFMHHNSQRRIQKSVCFEAFGKWQPSSPHLSYERLAHANGISLLFFHSHFR